MVGKEESTNLLEGTITSRIFAIRGERVILDVHLAELYGVETRALKQAVRRNRERFPGDFLFELTETEIEKMVSHFVIPSKSHLGGATPFAFTENGVAMLSSVLRSRQAIDMNIAIIRTFTLIRKAIFQHGDLQQEIAAVKARLTDHDEQFKVIFEYLKQLEKSKQAEQKQANRKRLGYRLPKHD